MLKAVQFDPEVEHRPGRQAQQQKTEELAAERFRRMNAAHCIEAAIADDPEVPGAFDAIEGVLLGAGDFSGVERAYVRPTFAGFPAFQADAATLIHECLLRARTDAETLRELDARFRQSLTREARQG